jgi:hypothetical protein
LLIDLVTFVGLQIVHFYRSALASLPHRTGCVKRH